MNNEIAAALLSTGVTAHIRAKLFLMVQLASPLLSRQLKGSRCPSLFPIYPILLCYRQTTIVPESATRVNDPFPIFDKHSHAYELRAYEDEDSFLSCLYTDHSVARRLNVIYESPAAWEIADLELFKQSPQAPPNRFFCLLREMRLWKPELINYRRRGLGAALLAIVEEPARQRRVKHIIGYVVRRDYEAWTKLLEWYANRGYMVETVAAPGGR